MKYYLIEVLGGVQPEGPHGPFDTEEERDEMARQLHWSHDEDDIVFQLGVCDDGTPQVSAYSGKFFEDDE